ncbi:Na/Pi cotransporter family protein [Tepidiphilus margaritifer]|uniref:Na/Pi cotransporter family protein n=1 Tax=Tepidiphilus margaritifer TaxID=203471 RepID=UPI000422FEF0|nr:Na/Pi symporter [Tepidiphilus margaritifer]
MKPIALWPAWARNLPRLLLLGLLGWWLLHDRAGNEMAAGVALFLLGIARLERGVRALMGSDLDAVLRWSTRTPPRALGFGLLATILVQSSVVVTLMAMSFVSAGMVALPEGLAIVLGAHVGTTTGTWLFAAFGRGVDIGAFALPCLTCGMVLQFSRERGFAGIGHLVLGIGLVFLGIGYIQQGFSQLESHLDLTAWTPAGASGILLTAAVGMLATVLMQSSHATLLITVGALSAGKLPFEHAMAIAIGANVGSSLTTLLAAIGAGTAARRVAVGHLLFGAITALLTLFTFPLFHTATLALAALLHLPSPALALALFHTLFNLVGALTIYPLLEGAQRLIERLVPVRRLPLAAPKHISAAQLKTPEVALESLRKETWRLYDRAIDLIALVLQVEPKAMRAGENEEVLDRPPERIHLIDIDALYQSRIKPLSGLILDFASRLDPPAGLVPRLQQLTQASREIQEAVKDVKHLQKNLVPRLVDPNPTLRGQYLRFRRHLVETLHAIANLPRDDGATVRQVLEHITDEALRRLETIDPLRDGSLAHWLRAGAIAPEEASSLMNDTAYVERITHNLLAAAQALLPPA